MEKDLSIVIPLYNEASIISVLLEDLQNVLEATNFSFEVILSRNWHYSWSKYYFFKKHYGIFFALKKIFPNFLRSAKKILIYKILLRDNKKFQLALAEFKGILQSVLSKPSNYRPFKKKN